MRSISKIKRYDHKDNKLITAVLERIQYDLDNQDNGSVSWLFDRLRDGDGAIIGDLHNPESIPEFLVYYFDKEIMLRYLNDDIPEGLEEYEY